MNGLRVRSSWKLPFLWVSSFPTSVYLAMEMVLREAKRCPQRDGQVMPPMEAFVDGDTDANLRGFQNNSHKCILFGKLKVCLSFQTGVATAGV